MIRLDAPRAYDPTVRVPVGALPVGAEFHTPLTRRIGVVLGDRHGKRAGISDVGVTVILDPLEPDGRTEEKHLDPRVMVTPFPEFCR